MTRASAALALVGLAAATLCDAAIGAGIQKTIVFDTAGGDTWRFERTVTGRLAPGACKTVTVESPSGEARAFLHGNRFAANIRLRSGANAVRATCWGSGVPVGHSRTQIWTVRQEDRPRAWIRAAIVESRVRMDAGATETAPGIPAPLASYEWTADPRNPAPISVGKGQRVEFQAPTADGEYRITLRVTDALGRSDESTAALRVTNGIATEIPGSDLIDNAVVYGAAPTLTTPVGFAGVALRLDAIAALGATILWLTPITAAPPGDFGYAVTDHFQVRASFGSEAQLHSLIDSAHAHGLKVLLDFVTNHLSDAHPYYEDAEHRGTRSPYYNWFERDATGKVVHYFDWTHLENLDYDNPDVRAYIVAACAYWVRVFHVDGFRMDAAWAVRERAPEMWPRLRRELQRIDPDIVLLAEASALDPYYRTHGFDAAYDWTRKLGEWAWQSAYADGDSPPDLHALRAALDESRAAAPVGTGFLTLRFLDNNDTGERFVTRHGMAQMRTAAALLFTLPGLPLIFAGEEVGAAFEPYRAGPPITWRDRYGLEPLYTRLARLRHDLPVLRSNSFTLLASDHDDAVLAYERDGSGERAVVVINFGTAPVTIALGGSDTEPGSTPAISSAPRLATMLTGRAWHADDILTHASFELGAGASTLPLSPHDALLLRLVASKPPASIQ